MILKEEIDLAIEDYKFAKEGILSRSILSKTVISSNSKASTRGKAWREVSAPSCLPQMRHESFLCD